MSTPLPDGPFTLADLPELGLTRPHLRRLLACGAVRRILRGVYVASTLEDTFELRVAAASRAAAAGHVIVDRTAAWVHGLETYSTSEREVGPAVETCCLRGKSPTRRSDVASGSRDLSADDVMVVNGVRVTTPLRTALDLGCHLRRREAFAALCQFARHHGITASVLAPGVRRFARRRGVVQLRELAVLVDPRFESPREAWTFLAIHDARLPHPTPQVWIDVDGVPTYRLDLAYPALRICVEYDGWDFHDRDEDQVARDRARRKWLRDHGWIVIVIKLGDFTGDCLERWIGELREALRTAYTTRRW
ncbi:hypothetical protein AB3X52_13735 [Nocardioides sp. DS6]|uniref:DUF559 domain-containing protein n=1 Tax=Nocardioides eburneus TaxID=3231482 RepID=A0ABV3T1M6_9ACTN